MNFDHIALISSDICKSVNWYQKNLGAECLYIDDTWGLINVSGTKIAFVIAKQHPPHICFEVDQDYIDKKLENKKFKKHRDGTESCYVSDCDGNFIEFLKCQKKT
jgi:catechol 2,3-dioxygenase-like lactoylglutathione lyase family enzyme